VSDVRHNFGLDTAGDLADPGEIDRPRVRRRTTDKKFRPVFFRDPLQLVVIDLFRLTRDAEIGYILFYH
jgi:hypothetical protein